MTQKYCLFNKETGIYKLSNKCPSIVISKIKNKLVSADECNRIGWIRHYAQVSSVARWCNNKMSIFFPKWPKKKPQQFKLKVTFFKTAQKDIKILIYFCKTFCCQGLSKIAQPGHAAMQDGLTCIRRNLTTENTHHMGKYHCMADLLFDWLKFDQTSKTVANST